MTGIGIDIVEFSRLDAIKNIAAFIHKVLSTDEQTLYENVEHEKRKKEFLAGRFALKEAIYKANNDFCKDKNYADFSILIDDAGAPYVAKPSGINCKLTLSHSENYVVAMAIFL